MSVKPKWRPKGAGQASNGEGMASWTSLGAATVVYAYPVNFITFYDQ